MWRVDGARPCQLSPLLRERTAHWQPGSCSLAADCGVSSQGQTIYQGTKPVQFHSYPTTSSQSPCCWPVSPKLSHPLQSALNLLKDPETQMGFFSWRPSELSCRSAGVLIVTPAGGIVFLGSKLYKVTNIASFGHQVHKQWGYSVFSTTMSYPQNFRLFSYLYSFFAFIWYQKVPPCFFYNINV